MAIEQQKKERGEDQVELRYHRHLHAVLRIHHGGKTQPHAVSDNLTTKHDSRHHQMQDKSHSDTDQYLLGHHQHCGATERINGWRGRYDRHQNPGQ